MKRKRMRKPAKAVLIVIAVLAFIALLVTAKVSPMGATLGAFAAVSFVFGMMGQTSGIEKSVKCTAAITEAYTIAKFGADDNTLSLATASTEDLVGIFQHTTANAGDEVRVMLSGISRLKLGGTVTRGGWVTSDANGKGVAIGAVAGTNYNAIGRVLASGVDGDIVPVFILPGRPQG